MAATKRIKKGDTAYDTVHAAWVENGRSASFTRQGVWGGCLYEILDTNADYPDIYQVASLGPTTFSETSARERPLTKGWHIINRDYWHEEIWAKPHRPGAGYEWRVKMTGAPNSLEPENTI